MIRKLLVGIMAMAFLAGAVAYVQAETKDATKKVQKVADKPVKKIDKETMLKVKRGEPFLGKASAPVTIIEYSSLSCPHCAHFHNDVLPELKKKYIESGKLRFINRDFPLNEAALRGAMLARCDRDKYYQLLEILYKSQKDWAYDKNFLNLLKNITLTVGLKPKVIEGCSKDKNLEDEILNTRLEAEKNLVITSTPTFYINGIKYEGKRDVKHFSAAIDSILEPKKPESKKQ